MKYVGVATEEMKEPSSAKVQQMINEALTASTAPMIMNVTPTEGQTVTIPDTDKEVILNLSPTADLNNLQVNLPGNSAGRVAQRIFIGSTRQIANCTFASALPVNNNTVMFSPGDNVAFLRNLPNVWSRLIS